MLTNFTLQLAHYNVHITIANFIANFINLQNEQPKDFENKQNKEVQDESSVSTIQITIKLYNKIWNKVKSKYNNSESFILMVITLRSDCESANREQIKYILQ